MRFLNKSVVSTKPRLEQTIWLLSLLICSLFSEAVAGGHAEECLYLNSKEGNVVEGCDIDPLRLSDLDTIKKAITALGLNGVDVMFLGCRQAPFSTSNGTAPVKRDYVIRYPILSMSRSGYIAPIIHELSHVFQSELAGGIANLKATLSDSLQRELGADFLTGIVFSNYINADRMLFQGNLNLLGTFREMRSDAHGTPLQRTSAFRMGTVLKLDPLERSIKDANQDFQDNRLSTVLRN